MSRKKEKKMNYFIDSRKGFYIFSLIRGANGDYRKDYLLTLFVPARLRYS